MKSLSFILSFFLATVSLNAQDYKISFAGTGASSNVGTVTVENLMQGKSVTLNGTEVLHLVASITGINPLFDTESALRIYPNPTNGNSTVDFVATASGKVTIELFDITGKRLGAAQNFLFQGTHSYQVCNLQSGIYTIRVSTQSYSYTGKLVSNQTANSEVNINYLGNSIIPITAKTLKSASVEKTMKYTTGDRLKITGTSGNYSTVVMDVPNQNKTLTFSFVACTDADGNNYPVIQIDYLIWMAKNLETTKYRNGDLIGTTTPSTKDISSEIWPIYQWAYDGNEGNVTTYGRLYTYFALWDNRNIAPIGWHVSTDIDWEFLIEYNGYPINAAINLQEIGTSHWLNIDDNRNYRNNSTGFSALPGGKHDQNGLFSKIGTYGYWWSLNSGNLWSRDMNYGSTGVYRNANSKGTGLSVRCVKD